MHNAYHLDARYHLLIVLTAGKFCAFREFSGASNRYASGEITIGHIFFYLRCRFPLDYEKSRKLRCVLADR